MEINNITINLINPQIHVAKKPECTCQEHVDSFQSSYSAPSDFSQMGKLLAKLAYDAGRNADDVSDQKVVQGKGLDSIISNPATTRDEKTLAQLGVKFGSHGSSMYDSTVAATRNEILSALCNPVPGPMGQVIAKLTYNAGCKGDDVTEQKILQQDGLETIISNEKVSQDEKFIAQLGMKFGSHGSAIYDATVAKTRNEVLTRLSNPVFEPMGQTIAKVTFNSGVKGDDVTEQKILQQDGLEAIISNYKTSEDEKFLAHLGMKFGSHGSALYDETVAKAGNEVLTALSNPVFEPMGQTIAKLAYNAGRKGDDVTEQKILQQDGLEAIISNCKTSQEEKFLSQLGIKFGSHGSAIYDSTVAKARNEILCALSNPVSGPIGPAIARLTYDIARKGDDVTEQKILQQDGLEAIVSSPYATEEQKMLARQAIDIGNSGLEDGSIASARNEFLKAMF